MQATQIKELVKSTKGKVFGIQFVKRTTGELRKMTCRTGARVGVTGEGRKYDLDEKNLLSVYDMKKGFRTIPIEGVVSFTFKGVKYE